MAMMAIQFDLWFYLTAIPAMALGLMLLITANVAPGLAVGFGVWVIYSALFSFTHIGATLYQMFMYALVLPLAWVCLVISVLFICASYRIYATKAPKQSSRNKEA